SSSGINLNPIPHHLQQLLRVLYRVLTVRDAEFLIEVADMRLKDLFTRYQVTKNFSVQGNINNLFDKTYDTNIDGSIVYGAPRNV
ncbi:TonB-dependent receptor, partial [Salmonella enterica subsp. enterica serovar Anatum]|nr:TonB-dependent receptor [Salmonella enterica subsp. enterica serovar Anatum]